MFGLFKKKSRKEKLLDKYNKLLKESFKLSTVSRKESDEKMFEANEVLKEIESLKSFGTNFGMSFQLLDDAIDYSSSNSVLGKNIGDDFKEGKITLPIILAFLRSNDEERQFWNRTIVLLDQKEDDFYKANQILKKYNCINDTIERAKHFANVATDSIEGFKESKYKVSLINLLSASLGRLS